MLIAMALIAMLAGIAIMSVDRANTDLDLSYNQIHEEQAFYVAEAGMERALAQLNFDKAWRTGFLQVPFNGGVYTVAVLDSVSNPLLVDTVVFRGTADFSGAKSNLEQWLVRGVSSPFNYGAFGDDKLLISNNACTDSYNSDSGTYAATSVDNYGDVGSNDTVIISGMSTSVGGSVSSATPNGIKLIGNPEIEGTMTTAAEPMPMNLISDADYAAAQANNSAPSGFVGTTYTYSAGDLTVKGKDLTLNSGTYYFNNLTVIGGGDIHVAAGANVKIYVTGNMLVEGNATVNHGGKPSDLMVFSKGSFSEIGDNGEFTGTLYAPTTAFVHGNNAYFFGAVIAKTASISNNACVHYDRSLANLEITGKGDYEQVAWKQME